MFANSKFSGSQWSSTIRWSRKAWGRQLVSNRSVDNASILWCSLNLVTAAQEWMASVQIPRSLDMIAPRSLFLINQKPSLSSCSRLESMSGSPSKNFNMCFADFKFSGCFRGMFIQWSRHARRVCNWQQLIFKIRLATTFNSWYPCYSNSGFSPWTNMNKT